MNKPILSHVFSNGLVLVAEPNDQLESAAFHVLVPAGSCRDPEDKAGLCGFVCEMSLRGAGPRNSRQWSDELDRLGVERGESVNASHTCYGGATLARNLFPALALYADLLRCPRLPEEELEAGRMVMLQELRAVEDEPSQKLLQELRRHQYPHPWGRPAVGDAAGIRDIGPAEIRTFYEQYYHPNELILGVAGRFDWDALRDHVETLFGDWQPRPTAEPVAEAPATRVLHIPYETAQTQIGIAYDSVPYSHPDYFQAWGAVGVLSGGMSSRLFTEVREKRGLCYSIHASSHSLKEFGSVFCYAGTTAERAQETLTVTLDELRGLAQGIRSGELDRLKARIKSSLVMQQESSSARGAAIARDWYHLGYARPLEEVEALIDGLTADSINAYLSEHPPHDFTVVTLGPEPLEIPVEAA